MITSTQLTTVDQPGSLEVYVYVPIEHSSRLKLGLPVQILDSEGKVIGSSRVSFVSPQSRHDDANGIGEGSRGHGNDALRQLAVYPRPSGLGRASESRSTDSCRDRLGGKYFAFVAPPQNGGQMWRGKCHLT